MNPFTVLKNLWEIGSRKEEPPHIEPVEEEEPVAKIPAKAAFIPYNRRDPVKEIVNEPTE